jgi:hypothetical protein
MSIGSIGYFMILLIGLHALELLRDEVTILRRSGKAF